MSTNQVVVWDEFPQAILDWPLWNFKPKLTNFRRDEQFRVMALNSTDFLELPEVIQTSDEEHAVELLIPCPGEIACGIEQISKQSLRIDLKPLTSRETWRLLTKHGNVAFETTDITISFNRELIVANAMQKNGFLKIRIEENRDAYKKIPVTISSEVAQAA